MRARRLVGAAVVAGTAFVACKFAPNRVGSDELPDAGVCTAVSAMCLGDTLRTCAAIGGTAVDNLCLWGCIDSGGAHCGRLLPAGGGVTIDDADPDALATLKEIELTGSTFNTDDGTIDGAAPPTGVEAIARGNIMVWRFKHLTLAGTVTIVGAKAAAFVATDGIDVDGPITAMGCTRSGGGSGEQPGPGGFAGAAGSGETAIGSGGGTGGAGPLSGNGGGGGGGNGGSGGLGGNGELAGPTYGNATIPVLAGGGGGGAGRGGGNFGRGGGGGGAIQLVSNVAITLRANGSIHASGCGGSHGDGNSDEGGGGGAGGTVLLEAPTITLGGAIAVNGGGGGGGGGNASTDGSNGTLSRTRAPGGDADEAADGRGGDGGAASLLVGENGEGGNIPGGGGGGVGRIRINTHTGANGFTKTGSMSPDIEDVPTTATVGIATTE